MVISSLVLPLCRLLRDTAKTNFHVLVGGEEVGMSKHGVHDDGDC